MTVEKHTTCPFCGEQHDRATHVPSTEATPDDGDVSFCFNCGEWSIFDETVPGKLRKPNDKEYEDIAEDKDCRRLREGWVDMHTENIYK